MAMTLRVLFIEDVEDDYLLVRRELQRGGFDIHSMVVETPQEVENALDHGQWDIVLSDYTLPQMDALATLRIVQRHDPDLPVIIISGTIGEETAVAALQQGAQDFMLKTNLARLVPAVTRALDNARSRRERRAAEEALRASEERLRQAQKLDSIGRMAGGIAHDFNNVLSVISGTADFLIADIPERRARVEDAREIRDAANRAGRLVSQLLAFSGRRILEPAVLDVNDLVVRLDAMLRRLIPETITIETRIASVPRVLADEGQFEQVLVNLVVNARDAMPDGGTIRIETTQLDNLDGADKALPTKRLAVIRVSDTGIGMDAETQERIFEPFFTTKAPGRGTGLGLSTVYGIVQQFDGAIRVNSRPGGGTTFEVLLPESQLAPEPRVRVQPARTLRGTETILLVDDEGPVRTVARRILERSGYTVLDTDSAEAALETIHREGRHIDALLSDLVMPGMTGSMLAAEVSRAAPHVQIILMSGYSEEDIEDLVSTHASHSYMPKPFDAKTLLQKVRVVLDSRPPQASMP